MSGLFTPAPFVKAGRRTLLEMITLNGLSTDLALCLDAGDANSYDGTSQTWFDVSENDQDFFRGTASSAQASDPTFNGVANGKSENEYFSLDGGDHFQEASAAVMNFAETWHKDNAAFTFGFIMYASDADNQASVATTIFANALTAGGAITGSEFYVSSGAEALRLAIYKIGTDPLVTTLKTAFLPASRSWLCAIASVDEANGNILVKTTSAAADLLTGQSYVAPDTAASSDAYTLMNVTNGGIPWASGVRLAGAFAWNRVLTTGELDVMFSAIKMRFPTLS